MNITDRDYIICPYCRKEMIAAIEIQFYADGRYKHETIPKIPYKVKIILEILPELLI